jgi:hypothetical protein
MASWKRSLVWCVVGAAALLAANALVAVLHAGSQAGQTYHWVCLNSGAELLLLR